MSNTRFMNRLSVYSAPDPLIVREAAGESAAEILGWELPKAFPIPFDSEKNEVEEVIFAYLLDGFLHRRPKPQQTFNSARAHARDLVDFDQFLVEEDLDWFDVQPRDIEEYVQALANTSSPATSREYAEGTIDRREYSIRRLYQWAFQAGLVTDPQFGKADVPKRICLIVGGEDLEELLSRERQHGRCLC